METNTPEKIWIDPASDLPKLSGHIDKDSVEYIRKDAFIEKALKWYCLDCECNDNCKDTKCFFHNAYKRYLEGDTNSLPPKFSNSILNEDGSTSDNWRYRHFTSKMQDAFIEKAAEWIKNKAENYIVDTPLCSYFDYKRAVDDFKNYMKGEKV